MTRDEKRAFYQAWRPVIESLEASHDTASGYTARKLSEHKLNSALAARKAKEDVLIWKLSYQSPEIEEEGPWGLMGTIKSWTVMGVALSNAYVPLPTTPSKTTSKPKRIYNERPFQTKWWER